jgi:hypothetical protein
MASTVSVTNIHSWLGERVGQSRGRSRRKKDAHLEILRLKNECQVEELAGGEDELQEVRVVRYRLLDERVEKPEL